MLRGITTNNAEGGSHPAADAAVLTPAIRWPVPPAELKLMGNEAHVFGSPLDLPKPRMAQLAKTLSAEEIERALRFHFQKDRDRFVVGRGLLREVLGWLLGVDPARIVFSYGDRGKPQLADSINGQFLHFNASHSDGLMMIAVCRDCEIGVDIERIRPVETTEPLVTQFFSPEELKKWFAMPASRRAEMFFDHWTRTEAFLKYNGEGIGDFPNPIFQCEDGCQMQSLRPAPNYAGAVVVENTVAFVRCWRWISPNDCDKSQKIF